MNTNETQNNDNQNEQDIQLNDLPVTDEQTEQVQGGTAASEPITVTGNRIRRPN